MRKKNKYMKVRKFDFNCFVGAETGLLKGLNLNTKSVINKNFQNKADVVSRDFEITAMCWDGAQQEQVFMGRHNQTVAVFDISSKSYVVSSLAANCGTGPINSIIRTKGVTITGVPSGEVAIWNDGDSTVINTLHGNFEDQTLARVRLDSCNPSRIVTGGRENDLQLWDITRPTEPLFKAKNVPHDWLDMRVPVWITDLTLINNGRSVATCTRHSQIRLYDIRKKSQPVLSFDHEEYPFTCMTAVHQSSNSIVVGTSHGHMKQFDLRGKYPKIPIRGYSKDSIGGTRDLKVHATLPFLFSASIDRYCRVHHLHTGELLQKLYLKSRLNCVLVHKGLKESDLLQLQEEIVAEPENKVAMHEDELSDVESECSIDLEYETKSKKIKLVA